MTVFLSEMDQRMIDGREGEAERLAMRFILRAAASTGATQLVDIVSTHLNGSFYTGQVGLDFARRMVELGARVRVPSTMTTATLALSQPGLEPPAPHTANQREVNEMYERLGARPAYTCAPYLLPSRPGLGDHVAWGESNAVAFANTFLGARTNKYGEPLDVAAAICGRVPASGLHLTEERAARVVFNLDGLGSKLFSEDAFYQVLGYHIGLKAGASVPALVGLPPSVSEDQLVALGAAGASSGAIDLVHVVGVTPEAPTLDAALQGREPDDVASITAQELRQTHRMLSNTHRNEHLGTVCLGAPHLSIHELEQLVKMFDGRRVAPSISFYASAGRFVAEEAQARGYAESLEAAGVTLVLDRCTYYGSLVEPNRGSVMTSSAKWAHYGAALLGARVIFGSMHECVESAVAGSVWTDEQALWGAP